MTADSRALLSSLQRGRRPYAFVDVDPLVDLALRLREAKAWCSANVDVRAVATCLRPSELAPAPLPRDRWHADDVVRLRRRHALLGRALTERDDGARGRLLVYFPDADLSDGAAAAESEGFFDVYNAPPYGTWVCYFEEPSGDVNTGAYLVAWVPEAFIPHAEAGISVNPEECIAWLSNTTVSVRDVVARSFGGVGL